MELKDLENFLISQQPEFYQFAMVLTADEDVSEKIILDSEYLLLSEERKELCSLMSKDISSLPFFRFSKRFILSSIFRIAKKNNLFQAPRNGKLEENAFWNLSMEQRAVLCLRHTMRMKKEEITEILDITKAEYFNLLNLSRESVLKNAGGLNSDIRETY